MGQERKRLGSKAGLEILEEGLDDKDKPQRAQRS